MNTLIGHWSASTLVSLVSLFGGIGITVWLIRDSIRQRRASKSVRQ